MVRLRERFVDWLTHSRESRAFQAKLDAAIDLIESRGFEVVYYCPEMGCQDTQLADAFSTLRRNSFVVMDKEGLLFGNRASTKQMSSEEKANEKRRRFLVVDRNRREP